MENVIALTVDDTEQARHAVRAVQTLHRSGDIRLEAVASSSGPRTAVRSSSSTLKAHSYEEQRAGASSAR